RGLRRLRAPRARLRPRRRSLRLPGLARLGGRARPGRGVRGGRGVDVPVRVARDAPGRRLPLPRAGVLRARGWDRGEVRARGDPADSELRIWIVADGDQEQGLAEYHRGDSDVYVCPAGSEHDALRPPR